MDYSLSVSNIEFIKKEISKSGLTYSHLMDELIDHVCCDIEHEMYNGLPFAKAYDVVKKKIGMEGLERIQHETLYLIDKKYRIMKNTMKISGLFAPILLSLGSLFKIQHWQGAGVLLVVGFFLLSFVFLPSAIYVSYKEVSNRTRKWTHVSGFLGTFFISVGFLFKIQHWPFAGTIITIGILLICLIFLPMVLNNRLKDKNDLVPKSIYVIAFAGFMIYLTGLLFKIMHWPLAPGLLLTGCVLLVFIAFPLYVYHMYKDHPRISGSYIFIVMVLVWFILPTSLISLNSSRNVLNNVYEMNQSLFRDIKFVEDNNRVTLVTLSEKQLALNINEISDQLITDIEKMENGITNNDIPDSTALVQLTFMIKEFEEKLLSMNADENYKSVIKRTLHSSFVTERQFYYDPSFLLHNLIFIQLSVRIAERTALRQLHLAENEQLQALNQ